MTLSAVLDRLESFYGKPEALFTVDPWEMILSENVVYLADDETRRKALMVLRNETGILPQELLAAPRSRLLKASRVGGILPDHCVDKVRDAASIAQRDFGGDLKAVLKLPLPQSLKALRKFPGVGEPGAEKILLFSGTHPFLALESNGLRALLRLGYGKEEKGYAASYRSAQAAAALECPGDARSRTRAYQLLRRHGQETCRRSNPRCAQCPVVAHCAYYADRAKAWKGPPAAPAPKNARSRAKKERK